MPEARDLFKELTDEAAKLNSEHWVHTGNNIPQANAMLAVLFKRIKELEIVQRNICNELHGKENP